MWLWNTKVGTLKDKLEPLWKGPGQLIYPITKSVWEVGGPKRKSWIRHSYIIWPYQDGIQKNVFFAQMVSYLAQGSV